MGVNFKELIIKILQESIKYRDVIIHSKVLRLIFFGGIIIGLLLFFIPLFFDNSMLKFSLIQKISRATNADFDINGDVEISFLPRPTITISEAVLLNYKHQPNFAREEELFNFYAKNIKIKFSIFDIYSDNLASEIEFTDGFFEVFSDPKNIPQRNNKITDVLVGYKKLPSVSPTESGLSISNKIFKFSEIIDDDFRHYLEKIPSIRFTNCSFSFFNKLGKNKDFQDINASLNFSQNYNFAEGSFSSEKIISKFEYQTIFNVDSIKPKSYFYLSSPNVEMHLKGNYSGENKGIFASNFKGDLTININDFKSFYKTYFADPKSHLIAKLRKNNIAINIKSNIENEDKEFNLKDIEIKSPIITGNGDLYFAIHENTPILDLDLNISEVDFDALISQEVLNIENYELPKVVEDALFKNNNSKVVNDDELLAKSKIINEKNISANSNNISPESKNINISQDQQSQDLKPIDNISKNSEEAKSKSQNINDNLQVVANSNPGKELISSNSQINNNKKNNLNLINSFKDFDVNVDVKIKNLNLWNNQFKDCDIYLTIKNTGEIMILPAIVKTPGNGSFYVRGIVDNKQIPKFIGSVDYKGKNLGEILKWLKLENNNFKFQNFNEFRFYSNLLMLPSYIAFDQIYFNLNKNATELFGESKIIRNNKNTSIINNFEITDFDLDKHIIFNKTTATDLSTNSLIKKIMWLNNINSNNQISLNFNKLTINQEDFIDQKINLKFNRGYFNVDNLSLRSTQTNLDLNLFIDISNQTPSINFKAIGPKLNLDPSNIQPAKPNEDNSVINEAENIAKNTIEKIEIFKNKSPINNDFLENFYSIPSLESFNGKIEVNIEDIALKNKHVKQLKFNGDLKNGTLDNVKSTWQNYNGDFSYSGLIDLKDNKIINGKISATNVNINELMKDIFLKDNIFGIANISANIISIANNKKDFLKDLKSEIRFSVVQPIISGFGINELVNKMFKIKIYRNELQTPEKILFNPESKSLFKQAKGSIILKNNNDGRIRVEFSGPAINSVLSGTLNVEKQNFDWLFNSIFLTGNVASPTPINLAIKIKGSPDEYTNIANTNQIRQYLGLQEQIYQSKFNAKENSKNNQETNQSQQNNIENNNSQLKSTDINKSQDNSTINNSQPNNLDNNQDLNSNNSQNSDSTTKSPPKLNEKIIEETKPLPNKIPEKSREEFKIIEINEE